MQGQVPRPKDVPDRPRSATPNLQGHARGPSLDAEEPAVRPASSQGQTLTVDPTSSRARTLSNASASKAEGVQYVALSGRSSPNPSPLGLRKGIRPPSSSLSDPRYKRYAQQVEKCLATFTEVSEWADFTAFLSRLHKSLQSTSSPPFTDIPHKLVIAKRLAQGLNPALPNGVHQRSLDVYREIFSMIGTQGLERDLLVWSSGLLPFFQFAATAVRPTVLELYETYYLPLGHCLRPITKALAIALLPGIEEETGDFHDRVLKLLDEIAAAVDPAFFAQSLFLTLITHPASRTSAMNYLNRRLAPRLVSVQAEEFERLVGRDSGLMARGLAAALQDTDTLVRRAALDFLNTGIPITLLSSPRSFSLNDAILLTNVACATVLSKDLSLSRRLYTWLLGTSDDASDQMTRFRRDAMALVVQSLKACHLYLVDSTHDASQQYQAYKVFVALLDKWEIGYPLSQAIAFDCLSKLYEDKGMGADEDTVRITSQAIYNAVEPFVVWGRVYRALVECSQDSSRAFKTLNVLEWLLESFPVSDREVSDIHAPFMLAYLVNWVDNASHAVLSPAELDKLVQIFKLLIALLPTERDASQDWTQPVQSETLLEQLAAGSNVYYASKAEERPPVAPEIRSIDLVPALFQNLTSSSTLIGLKRRLRNHQRLGLLHELVEKLRATKQQVTIQWDRKGFLDWIVSVLEAPDKHTLLQIAEISADLEATTSLRPPLHIVKTAIPKDIQMTAFRLLRKSRSPEQAELVSTITRIHTTVNSHLIENVVMECLGSDDSSIRSSIAAFSVMWSALAGSSRLPLDKPMFFLLDQLDSGHPAKQRAIQAWLKQEPSGFLKMIDRIMSSMLARSPPVKPSSIHVGDRDYECLKYQRRADIRILAYHVSKLQDVIRLGGRPLRTAMEDCNITEPTLLAFAEAAGMPQPCQYSHFVLETLVRFLFSRDSTRHSAPEDIRFYIKISQLLRLFCGSEWHFDVETLGTLKHDMINRLSLAVATREVDLQEELLKLLQRLLLRSHPPVQPRKSLSGAGVDREAEADQQNYALLLQAVHSGITDPRNTEILPSWLEFSLVLGNSLPSGLRPLLFPLIDMLSRQVQYISSVLWQPSTSANTDCCSEKNLILLLQAVDSLVHYTLGDGFNKVHANLGRTPVVQSETTGLLGYVFSSPAVDAEISNIENGLPKTAGLESMRSVIALLILVHQRSNAVSESRIEEQATTSLSSFYRLHPQEFLESVIDISFGEDPPKSAFSIIDNICEGAHQVVDTITSIISRRLLAGDDQRKRNHSLTTEFNMITFLRNYIGGLEAPIAVQASTFCLSLAKTLIQTSNVGQRKRLAPGIFEILTVMLRKVASTSALTDRRYRKDVQDTFLRTLDVMIGSLIEGIVSMNQGENIPRDVRARVIETREFVATLVIPNLRSILVEEERIVHASTALTNAFVLPTLKSRSRAEPISQRQALEILTSLSRISQTLKLWKSAVLEVFNESSFFETRPEFRMGWRSIIATMMDQDRERLPELLVRVGTPLSGNFFSNKEAEASTKAANIRRLSLVLLAAEPNQYLAQLPHIQERLVDILRTPTSFPKISAEVYLCLRVLLCRFSSQHLTNFWPLILTELIKIFENTMSELPKDNSDQLVILLAACKFLDLLIALQMEDFQIHQWMFLTDTADAADGESFSQSESILDRLANLVLETGSSEEVPAPVSPPDAVHLEKRRPVLANTYTIHSVQALRTFLVKASTLAYEGVYRATGVDWEYIEQSLEDEVFRAI